MWINRQDLLYSMHSTRRAPLLSVVAIVALTLGIGLNAGIFTLLNAMFLTSPTRKDPGTFLQIYPRYEGSFTGAGQFSRFTTQDYDAIHVFGIDKPSGGRFFSEGECKRVATAQLVVLSETFWKTVFGADPHGGQNDPSEWAAG